MGKLYSRRSMLSAGGVTGSVLVSGCYKVPLSSNREGTENEIPIFVKNNDDAEHRVTVELFSSGNDHDVTVTVGPSERTEVTTSEESFCLRGYLRTVGNMKDIDCPAPDESDYSESGYVVNIYSSKDTGKHNQRIKIESVE